MAQPNPNILIPYSDYIAVKKDADDKAAALAILNAEFPDEACRLVALKSVLGYVEPQPDPEPTPEPDPEPTPDPDPTTDPNDPSNTPSDPSNP